MKKNKKTTRRWPLVKNLVSDPESPLATNDLIYLAGFLDGEGCFTTDGRGRSQYVTCANAHKDTMVWIYETFGGSLNERNHNKPYMKPNWKQQYVWYLCGKPCVNLVTQLLPYLKQKKQQAVLLIEHREASPLRREEIKEELKREKKTA